MTSMNSGSGPLSYVQNSSYQRGALDVAKSMIEEEIVTKFNIKHLEKSGVVFIADFGCSTGQNSFPAIQIITQTINHKYESAEFHVFFNDVVSNDFNTLFTSLPPHVIYHATGLPGDFHGRLLPESSVHFVYSSWSLHWLSQVPKVVVDSNSPAWNKGQILYTENRKEVCDAYLDQYTKDVEAFLECRAVELVCGGLMALLIPGLPQFYDPQKDWTIHRNITIMGSCLKDLAKMGKLSEEKIDSFNIPNYYPTPKQLKTIMERNRSFSFERMEILDNHGKNSNHGINARAAAYRAVYERLLSYHFGDEIMDELFVLFEKKLAASPLDPGIDKSIVILVMLKRKAD